MNRTKIEELLRDVGSGEGPDRASILAALRLIATAIDAGEVRHGHAAHGVATAMGFVVAGRRREAAWWARQAISGVALPVVLPDNLLVKDLISGIEALEHDEPGD